MYDMLLSQMCLFVSLFDEVGGGMHVSWRYMDMVEVRTDLAVELFFCEGPLLLAVPPMSLLVCPISFSCC